MAILAAPVRQITGARPASRGANYPLLGLALVGLAVAKLATVYWEMEQRIPKASLGAEGCTRYQDIMSPEDIIPVFEGVFIGSSDERRQAMMRSIGAEASPWGGLFAIWNVDTPGEEPKTAQLEIVGFPEGTAFHPHGMHYRAETEELFVVNHAFSQGGERIDVFKVSQNFPQELLPPVHACLLEVTPPPPPAEEAREEKPAEAVEGESESGSGSGSISDPAVGGMGDEGGDDIADRDAAAAGEGVAVERDERDGEAGDKRGGRGSNTDAGNKGSEETSPVADAKVNMEQDEDFAAAGKEGGEKGGAATDEEVVETPKEQAKRLKREAKEAAAKAKADEKQRLAAEKAAAKAAAVANAARAKGLARGVAPLKLTYSFSVEHELINTNYGALNDLVLVDDDELYVTQWQAFRQPLHGPTMPDSVLEYLRLFGTVVSMLLQISPAPVIRCTGIRGPATACEPLAKGRGVMYNGIALSPNGERLLVSDTLAMQMLVFNRSVETGALTLRQRVDLPGSPDNLEIDPYRAAEGTEAYTVGLIRGFDFMKYTATMHSATYPTDGDHVKMAGGGGSVVFNKDSGKYESHLEMWQDGSLLSVSSAAPTKSGARIFGSAVEEGFLLCRPPQCPLSSSPSSSADGREASGNCPWGSPPPSAEDAQDPE